MANDLSSKPSFSFGIKLRILLQVTFTVIVVAAVVVMANYLSGRYFVRFHLNTHTSAELSSRTLNLVKSLTNEVAITLFYDREDGLYTTVAELAQAYQRQNPKISVRTVDYIRSAAEAQEVKIKYSLPSSLLPGHEKNWVIFDCEGRVKTLPGNALANYTLEQEAGTNEFEFRRKLAGFKGEMMFTPMLLAVSSPKPLKAYFLQGDGEVDPADEKELAGFGKFTGILVQNYVQPQLLSLLGTNSIPEDCNLLIVAAPTSLLPDEVLTKISLYLNEGGRMLVFFNAYSVDHPTGLEKILATWGVSVGNAILRDPKNTYKGQDIYVRDFARHPVVDSLVGSVVQLFLPRAIGAIDANVQVADAPKVQEIAFTGPQSFAVNDPSASPRRFPLMVAVEKGAPNGVVNDRGTTRLLVIGDSFFLGNQVIESAANRDFASYAINWLLDRPVLLQGLGPRPVAEYRVLLTSSQMKTVQWILLGAMPGTLLLFGGLVWLRRRK